jgi:hypothetical protein
VFASIFAVSVPVFQDMVLSWIPKAVTPAGCLSTTGAFFKGLGVGLFVGLHGLFTGQHALFAVLSATATEATHVVTGAATRRTLTLSWCVACHRHFGGRGKSARAEQRAAATPFTRWRHVRASGSRARRSAPAWGR